MANVLFKNGTKAKFDALAVKDSNTLYWLYDVRQLYKGDVLYATGAEATSLASGLMSAADKAKLDSLNESGIANLTAVDNTVVIADSGNGKTVGVRISKAAGNTLEVKNDGLYIAAPNGVEFAIERQGTASDGAAATYKLKRIEGENVTYAGDAINIPNDLILQSGSIGTVTEAGNPYDGAAVGDPYIDLVLSDSASTHIYILVKGMVAPVTAGNGVKVEDNAVSIKLSATNSNGLEVSADGLSLSAATASTAGAMSAADKAALDTAVSDIESIRNSIVWGNIGE